MAKGQPRARSARRVVSTTNKYLPTPAKVFVTERGLLAQEDSDSNLPLRQGELEVTRQMLSKDLDQTDAHWNDP